MDKIFRLVGGRKFLLSVGTIALGTLIDLVFGGLSASLATLVGTIITAFCASNWLNSREYHKAESEKRKSGSAELGRIENKLKVIQEKLDSEDSSSYYVSSLNDINQSLGTLLQTQQSVMQSTDSTNKLIKAAMQSGG